MKTSILIPSRNERFLFNTVCDLLQKAQGDIEIICVLDGYWTEPVADPRVHYIHRGQPLGMRAGINAAAAIAKGEFLLKIDAHCMVDEGFDVQLAKDCEDDMIMIPRRKRLDAENWCEQDVGKPPVDYEYLSFPDNEADFGGPSMNGRIWTQRIHERMDDPRYDIDDMPASQGSAWFMRRDYFERLGLMDDANWGPFWCEAQELAFRCILTGGRYVVNKRTSYYHLHKGKKYGRGYNMNSSWITKGRNQAMRFFAGEKVWEDQKHPLSFLIEKFMPMPGWTEEAVAALKERELLHFGR